MVDYRKNFDVNNKQEFRELLQKLWNYQQGFCPFCEQRILLFIHLTNVHHVNKNRTDPSFENLQLLHQRCHKDFHNCFKTNIERINFQNLLGT